MIALLWRPNSAMARIAQYHSDQSSDLTEKQTKIMKWFFSTYFVCYSLMLILTVYMSVRYIWPMKRHMPQIWVFYTFAILMYTGCLCEYGYYFATGVDNYAFEHDFLHDGTVDFGIVMCLISDSLAGCLYLMVTLTMYNLYLGLAYVNRRYTSMQCVRKRQTIARWVFGIFCSIEILFLIPRIVWLSEYQYLQAISWATFAVETASFLTYSFIVYKLSQQMRLLQGMDLERRLILIQSLSFLFTFVVSLVEYLTLYAVKAEYNAAFAGSISSSFCSMIFKCVPPLTVIVNHYKSFGLELKNSQMLETVHQRAQAGAGGGRAANAQSVDISSDLFLCKTFASRVSINNDQFQSREHRQSTTSSSDHMLMFEEDKKLLQKDNKGAPPPAQRSINAPLDKHLSAAVFHTQKTASFKTEEQPLAGSFTVEANRVPGLSIANSYRNVQEAGNSGGAQASQPAQEEISEEAINRILCEADFFEKNLVGHEILQGLKRSTQFQSLVSRSESQPSSRKKRTVATEDAPRFIGAMATEGSEATCSVVGGREGTIATINISMD